MGQIPFSRACLCLSAIVKFWWSDVTSLRVAGTSEILKRSFSKKLVESDRNTYK